MNNGYPNPGLYPQQQYPPQYPQYPQQYQQQQYQLYQQPNNALQRKTTNGFYGQLPEGILLNNKYKLIKTIGSGAFSFVYLAKDVYNGMDVAIKELFVPMYCSRKFGSQEVCISDPESEIRFAYLRGRFADEFNCLAKLRDNSQVIKYYEYFYCNNTAYMVIEYLTGLPLDQYIDRSGGRLPLASAITLMNQLLDVLEDVHKHGIVHRDLKPENLFLTSDLHLKLIDFGAGRFSSKEKENSIINELRVITHGFAPPEQYVTNKAQGAFTDVYATGAICYYMLTGVIPGTSIDRRMSDTLAAPIALNPSIPANISNAIMRAMELEPELRYRSAKEFKKGLTSGSTVRSAASVGRKKKAGRRLVTLTVLALAALLAAGAYWLYGHSVHVYDLVREDSEVNLMLPLNEDIQSEKEQIDAWRAVTDDFSDYITMRGGGRVTFDIVCVDEAGYDSAVKKAAADGTVALFCYSDQCPINSADTLELTAEALQRDFYFSADTKSNRFFEKTDISVCIPVSYDKPVLFTNDKLMNKYGVRAEDLRTMNDILSVHTDEAAGLLAVCDILRGYAAAYEPLTRDAFTHSEALFYIGMLSESNFLRESEIKGYYTISPLPSDFGAPEEITNCFGVTDCGSESARNAAQLFLAYISGSEAQDTLYIQNGSYVPVNTDAEKAYLEGHRLDVQAP